MRFTESGSLRASERELVGVPQLGAYASALVGAIPNARAPTLLSINNYFYRRGGAEAVFLQHGELLEGCGWQVVPFAMHHPLNRPSPWSRFFADEIELGRNYSLGEKLRNATRVIYSSNARTQLRRLLDVACPSVAHAHNVYHHLSPAIFGILKSRAIPVVLTLHDLKLLCPAYLMLAHDGICERCKGGAIHNVLLHRCIKGSVALSGLILLETLVHRTLGLYRRNVDRFVVPSRFLLEKCVEWGWPRERFAYIPNAVDLTKFPSPLASAAPGNEFLYVGRLAREKGLHVLIDAAHEARVPLAIAGDGQDAASIRAYASGLGSNVRFLGQLGFHELVSAIGASRAVVVPSEWYENAPMTILEAYALGRPVIGSRLGGIAELVRDRGTGALFPAGDRSALAELLVRFRALPDHDILSMGMNGRRWVEDEFTTERYRQRTLDLYRGLVPEIDGPASGSRQPIQ